MWEVDGESWWLPQEAGQSVHERKHQILPTGHGIALGNGESSKTTVNKLLKTRPRIVAEFQEKYGRWHECSRGCGENSRDFVYQTLYQVHGDNNFFRWHPKMDSEIWEEEIFSVQLEKPSFVSFEDPESQMRKYLNTRYLRSFF